jgi:hypothetical protein
MTTGIGDLPISCHGAITPQNGATAMYIPTTSQNPVTGREVNALFSEYLAASGALRRKDEAQLIDSSGTFLNRCLAEYLQGKILQAQA